MDPVIQFFSERMPWTERIFSVAGNRRTVRGPLPAMSRDSRAFTLLELVLVVAIVGTISAIAVPSYIGHREKVLAQEALGHIISIDLSIQKYFVENGRYPDSLAEIGKDGMRDPWGNPYQYLNVANDPHQNLCKKFQSQHPINTDFDLYSSGKDGRTNKNIGNAHSWDDVIRAYDGAYMGPVMDII